MTPGDDGALRVTGRRAGGDRRPRLAEGIAIHGLRTEQASLEDVFFELTGEQAAPR